MSSEILNERESKPLIVFLAFALEIFLVLLVLGMFSHGALAGIAQNVTVITRLDVGNSAPEVFNISIDGGNSIDLIPNSTKNITIYGIIRDYNGDGDINVSNLTIFDISASSYGAASDNNNHYTNSSCIVDTSFGDALDANVTCTVYLWYYANNATWNVTMYSKDTLGLSNVNSIRLTVNTLLSLGLPDVLDYGTVNATFVSSEKVVNVTNFGNVMANITLEGYAVTRYDNYSMNCTLGANKNISIFYEKYNLTGSNNSDLTYAQFDSIYVNLTSAPITKRINSNFRQNDIVNEAENSTYWRIYVPSGVAGSCSGNIIFSAIRAPGT